MSDSYVPGTEEKDPKKVIMALQQQARTTAGNSSDITTLQTDLNAAESAITALQAIATASVAGLAKKLRVATVYDAKSSGTNGGTFTSGDWRTRDLNTEVDPDGIVSISSNDFTLGAGTYVVLWWAPTYIVDLHICRLLNVTDSLIYYGGNAYSESTNGGATESSGVAIFTIAGSKAFRLQHYCTTTRATNGFGNQIGLGVSEIYSRVLIVQFDP